jgi:hypothetical protein
MESIRNRQQQRQRQSTTVSQAGGPPTRLLDPPMPGNHSACFEGNVTTNAQVCHCSDSCTQPDVC